MKQVPRKAVALALIVVMTGLVVTGLATASRDKKAASKQVCVLLPDTKSSVRWRSRPLGSRT